MLKTTCHSERSRGIPLKHFKVMPRDPSTSLRMTTCSSVYVDRFYAFSIKSVRLVRRIQRSPEIPGGHRTVRTPFFTELHELFWSGEFSAAESFRETFAHPVIVNGPDIRPAQIEKKKHFNRPSANSTHRGQTHNDLIIAHADKRAARWHG